MVGSIVKSIAGHDAGKIYVVIAEATESLLLADGVIKTKANPKRKNRKHVEMLKGELPSAVREWIMKERTDESIRQTLHHYIKCNK